MQGCPFGHLACHQMPTRKSIKSWKTEDPWITSVNSSKARIKALKLKG